MRMAGRRFVDCVNEPYCRGGPFFLLSIVEGMVRMSSSVGFCLLKMNCRSPCLRRVRGEVSRLRVRSGVVLRP